MINSLLNWGQWPIVVSRGSLARVDMIQYIYRSILVNLAKNSRRSTKIFCFSFVKIGKPWWMTICLSKWRSLVRSKKTNTTASNIKVVPGLTKQCRLITTLQPSFFSFNLNFTLSCSNQALYFDYWLLLFLLYSYSCDYDIFKKTPIAHVVGYLWTCRNYYNKDSHCSRHC